VKILESQRPLLDRLVELEDRGIIDALTDPSHSRNIGPNSLRILRPFRFRIGAGIPAVSGTLSRCRHWLRSREWVIMSDNDYDPLIESTVAGSSPSAATRATDTLRAASQRASEAIDSGREPASYGPVFLQRIRAMGIRDHPIAPRSPRQNACVERLIGSIRRECLGHMIVFGEAHLRRILRGYAAYYNVSRTHRSLNKDAPLHRAIERPGAVVSRPVLGGLHHQYCRI
jgi:hypothetical protein